MHRYSAQRAIVESRPAANVTTQGTLAPRTYQQRRQHHWFQSALTWRIKTDTRRSDHGRRAKNHDPGPHHLHLAQPGPRVRRPPPEPTTGDALLVAGAKSSIVKNLRRRRHPAGDCHFIGGERGDGGHGAAARRHGALRPAPAAGEKECCWSTKAALSC